MTVHRNRSLPFHLLCITLMLNVYKASFTGLKIRIIKIKFSYSWCFTGNKCNYILCKNEDTWQHECRIILKSTAICSIFLFTFKTGHIQIEIHVLCCGVMICTNAYRLEYQSVMSYYKQKHFMSATSSILLRSN